MSNSTVKSRLEGRLGNEPVRVTVPLFRSKENVHGTWFTDSGIPKSMKEAAGAPVSPGGWPWRAPRPPCGVNGVQSPMARNASLGAPSRDTENAMFSPPSEFGSRPPAGERLEGLLGPDVLLMLGDSHDPSSAAWPGTRCGLCAFA